MKHVTIYDVDTKELGSCVSRKYKQFLWLYDRLAENFPCISLPPLPVKQSSGIFNVHVHCHAYIYIRTLYVYITLCICFSISVNVTLKLTCKMMQHKIYYYYV